MALGDITIYSKDNGFGYPGDINYPVVTATTVPTILSGEPVTRAVGAAYPSALASGTGASFYPVAGLPGPVAIVPILGVAASTSDESTSGPVNGNVCVTPVDADVTYLVSTLATSLFFGNPATSQITYDQKVGYRTTFNRVGGTGAAQLGGTYYINASDASAGGLIVESLDIVKFPGKVRFSFRKGLSYRG